MKHYMDHRYGCADRFVYDGEDPVERIAALAWDAALGRCGLNPASEALFQSVLAIEIAQLTQKLASSARTAAYVSQLGLATIYGSRDLAEGLRQAQGICGNHRDIFIAALTLLEIPSRAIGVFYHKPALGVQNHAMVECRIGGGWRFFDLSWGAVWLGDPLDLTSILSFDQVDALTPAEERAARVCNQLDPWYRMQAEAGLDAFGYLHAETRLALLKGDAGSVNYLAIDGKVELVHLPKYFGARRRDGETLVARFTHDALPPDAPIRVQLDIRAIAGKDKGHAQLRADDGTLHPVTPGPNALTLRNGGALHVVQPEGSYAMVSLAGIGIAP